MILCGIPSSGKSAIALKVATILENEFDKLTIIVGSDSFRDMMPASRAAFKPEREPFVRNITFNAIATSLQSGYVVINDDLNYYVSMRKDLSQLARSRRAGFGMVYVNTPLMTALAWNEKRGTPVPHQLIKDIYAKFEEPGKKYKWDAAISTVDPSCDDLDALAISVAEATIRAMTVWGRPLKTPPSVPKHGEYEKVTRRAMGEIMKRFKRVDLAVELADLRKAIVRRTIRDKLPPEVAATSFTEGAEEIVAKYVVKPEGQTVFHVGLFGHVDHGKTALAECLTERPSTAALDKHPEAQRRGMTIDMGFSSFSLREHMVNLVDLPGHYTLIKHVTGGTNIVDVGLLVVAADEGPKVQTLEHFRILDNFGVKQLLVVITKKDLVTPEKIDAVQISIRRILEGSPFENARMVVVSAITKEGIDLLKDALHDILKPPMRDLIGPFRMPIDHIFHIRGMGTVATGTVLRGSVVVGEEVELLPARIRGRVRVIQMFGIARKEAKAGDRVGFAVSNVRPADASRGSEFCTPGSLTPTTLLLAETKIDMHFGYPLKRGDQVHVNVGLQTVTASFTPFSREKGPMGELNVVSRSVAAGDQSLIFLETIKAVIVGKGDKLLLMKLDFSPRRSRVVGVGRVIDLPSCRPVFVVKRVRRGSVVKQSAPKTFIVQDLFASREAANHSLRRRVVSESGAVGAVVAATGSEGDVLTEFGREIAPGERVVMIWYRRLT